MSTEDRYTESAFCLFNANEMKKMCPVAFTVTKLFLSRRITNNIINT